MFYADRFLEVVQSEETLSGGPLNLGQPDITVRAGTVTDLDALETIESRAFSCNRIARRSFTRFLSSGQTVLLVADHADPCIGYAIILFRTGSQTARLYSIAVDGTEARHGVGTALLKTTEKVAGHRGSTSIRLEVREDNWPALNLYRKFGYQVFGQRPFYYEDGSNALRLHKQLACFSGRGTATNPATRNTANIPVHT
jgi:ribosomal-protein-alanine acetyltransferase